MNLGQLLGEQSLRIEQLEDLLAGQGVDTSAGLEVQELQAKLRTAIEVRESEAEAHWQVKKELERTIEGLRRQLQGSALQLKLDAEVKARAVDAAGFRKRILELEWKLDHQKPAAVAAAPAVTPAVTPVTPPRPQFPPRRGRRGREPQHYIPRPGTVNAEILALINRTPGELDYSTIVAALPQFTVGNISVALGWMTQRECIERTGVFKHFRYSKKLKAAA